MIARERRGMPSTLGFSLLPTVKAGLLWNQVLLNRADCRAGFAHEPEYVCSLQSHCCAVFLVQLMALVLWATASFLTAVG